MSDERSDRRMFTVSFQGLDQWSVGYFRSLSWKWPEEYIQTLGTLLKRVELIVSDEPIAIPIIEKISFDGVLSLLSEEMRTGYKGRLFRAESGQLVYSKIRVKQGSVCIIPEDVEWVAVSAEYPVYEVESNRIDPAFLVLVLRSESFKHYLDGISHGGSTKTRIHPTVFESLRIPVPPMMVQHRIVEYWRAHLLEISRLDEREEHLLEKARRLILDQLGIAAKSRQHVGKMFTLSFSDLSRWSYDYNRRVLAGLSEVSTGVFPAKSLGEICEGWSGSTPPKKVKAYWENGVLPWVSPKDMKAREIRDSVDHVSQSAIEDGRVRIVPTESLIFVVRSGILQRKVPVAISVEEVAVNQDLRAYTPNIDAVSMNYLLAYFEARQDELLQLVKWSTTVQSINREELDNFPVPLPPMQKQLEIADAVGEIHKEVKQLQAERRESIIKRARELERIILGIDHFEGELEDWQ